MIWEIPIPKNRVRSATSKIQFNSIIKCFAPCIASIYGVADLIWGFWEKAGFQVVGTFHKRAWDFDEDDKAIVHAQMAEKGMTEEEVWTWYRMACEL